MTHGPLEMQASMRAEGLHSTSNVDPLGLGDVLDCAEAASTTVGWMPAAAAGTFVQAGHVVPLRDIPPANPNLNKESGSFEDNVGSK